MRLRATIGGIVLRAGALLVPVVGIVVACTNPVRPPLRTVSSDPSSASLEACDAFTVIFVGDPEARMRGNSPEKIAGYVDRIRRLGDDPVRGFSVDGERHPVDPEVVIVGGDISRDRETSIELDLPLWQPLLDDGIVVLAGFGNHDWEPESWGDSPSYSFEGHRSNESTTAFTRETYRRSAEVSPSLSYVEVGPTARHGPVTFHATFKGVDIVNFNTFLFQPSYEYPDGWPLTCNPLGGGAGCQRFVSAEPQIERMEELLEGGTDRPTIFVQHYPLSTSDRWWDDYDTSGTTTEQRRRRLLELMATRDESIFLAGHNHRPSRKAWAIEDREIPEFVAPYFGGGGGVLAVLISPTRGVLDVRTLEFD